MTAEQQISRLNYAIGLAIGALETINATPYDFNKDGLANVLQRLKELVEAPLVIQEWHSFECANDLSEKE